MKFINWWFTKRYFFPNGMNLMIIGLALCGAGHLMYGNLHYLQAVVIVPGGLITVIGSMLR